MRFERFSDHEEGEDEKNLLLAGEQLLIEPHADRVDCDTRSHSA